MEVVYDLDTEAAATAARLGITLRRAPTVGTDPEFVAGLVDLALERAAEARASPPSATALPRRLLPQPARRSAHPLRPGKDPP